ncbi:hypothetical protein BBJ28_00019877, partial [Nothophytophthora sp. Chile5]
GAARALLASGAAIELADDQGFTALMAASQNGHTDVVELLLANKASVDTQLPDGATALKIACQHGQVGAVRALLASGAAIELATDQGFTALMAASQKGHTDVVELLLANKASVDTQHPNGATALTIACQQGQVGAVRALLASGAAIELATDQGFTALMSASQKGHTDVVELLLANKASVDTQLPDGATALTIACQQGQVGAVRALLASGAAIELATDQGFTALMAASEKGHTTAVPVGGDVLSALVTELLDKVKADKDIEDQCGELRDDLPSLLVELHKLPDSDDLVKTVLKTVEEFNKVVQGREITHTLDRLIDKAAKASFKAFKLELSTFRGAMNTLMTILVPFRTLQRVAMLSYDVKELRDSVQKILEELQAKPGGFRSLLRGDITEDLAKQYESELKDALERLRHGTAKRKRQAQEDLACLALHLVHDGNDDGVATGLRILDGMAMVPRMRSVVIQVLVVKELIDVVRDPLSEANQETASRILEHLAEESKPFFKQLEPVSKLQGYPRVITEAGLVPWIVRNAKPVIISENGQLVKRIHDENAFSVLVSISETKECKSAIAQAEGIATLVAIYQSIKEMSEDGTDPAVLHVIDALASLSEDEECRKKFAEHHDMWPLLHFLWKCSTIDTTSDIIASNGALVDEWDENGEWVGYKCKPTQFGLEKEKGLFISIKDRAGRALWKLSSLDDDCKRRVVDLGWIIDLDTSSENPRLKFPSLAEVPRVLRDGEEKCTHFDAIFGWLVMASIDKTHWFERILWNLMLDEKSEFAVAEWCYGSALGEYRHKYRPRLLMKPLDREWNLHTQESSEEESSEEGSSIEGPSEVGSTNEEPSEDVKSVTSEEEPSEDVKSVSSDKVPSEDVKSVSSDEDSMLSDEDSDSSDEGSPDEEAALSDEESESSDEEPSENVKSRSIKSICGHLSFGRFKRFDSCLEEVINVVKDGEGVQKVKALGVLWLCAQLLSVEPKNINPLIASCKKAVLDEGSWQEVFWATCLLLSMLSWKSLRKSGRKFHLELLESAADGVCFLLKDDKWPKFVFLAKYVLVESEPEDMSPRCIPFLLASFKRFQSIGASAGPLDDDSFFQSPHFRRKAKIDGKRMLKQCSIRLVVCQPDLKRLIKTTDGVSVLKAMVRWGKVGPSTKQDIKQMLKDEEWNLIDQLGEVEVQHGPDIDQALALIARTDGQNEKEPKDQTNQKMKEASKTAGDHSAIAGCWRGVKEQLLAYEGESRLLIKLADTARVVGFLKRATNTALGILNLLGSPDGISWHQALLREREDRMVFFEALLADDEWMAREVGDEQQQLEVLTRLKHGLEQYVDVLNPRELDVMSAVFDAIVRFADVVVAAVPQWFAISKTEWSRAEASPIDEGEEVCVRDASF